MESEVKANADGVITFCMKQGDQIQTGDVIAEIK